MASVREPTVMYDGGFDSEASAFDAVGYGGHDALLSGVDAVALLGGYGYAHDEPAGAASAYVPDSASWTGAGASVLAFDRAAEEEADCDAWMDAMDEDQGQQHAVPASTIGFDPASGCFSLTQRSGGERPTFGLLFPSTSSKRSYAAGMQDAETRATKKPCGASRKASKAKPAPTTTLPKDPQNLTAKNRREKISERLRTLQELVPNGTKVDMVTMLEKAISYVKFLQLQVKVLATDEFWPAQGGTAPEISQVIRSMGSLYVSPGQPSPNVPPP